MSERAHGGVNEHRELWCESPTVSHGRVLHLEPPAPFETELGARLQRLQMSYESWGAPNAARDNTVLVVHPLTADPHVTGEFAGHEPGWWEPIVGPGRPIDTARYHVVCPNLIGGCYGSTGPRFPHPDDGSPYGDRFPLLTPRDLMRAQRLFLDAIGIERLALVIGPSMGGMIAWEWLIEAPERVDAGIVVAAPLASGPYQIALSWLQRMGIQQDEAAGGGRAGQTIARGVGMVSYRSPAGLEEKFGRVWFKAPGSTLAEPGTFNVESWLSYHGKRLAKRYDPRTYALLSRAMDLHDVARERGDLASALARIRGRVLLVGITSDHLYPPAEIRGAFEAARAAGVDIVHREIRSENGHDGFLLDTQQLGALVASFLGP